MDNQKFLREAGLAAIEHGFSIIPINAETKRPYFRLLPLLYDAGQPAMRQHINKDTGEVSEFHARGWKPYQSKIAKPADVNRWVDAGAQLMAF